MKRIHNSNSALLGTGALLAGLLCWGAWRNVQAAALRASALNKRFISQHILDKTTALLSVITPSATPTTGFAEYYTVYKGHSLRRNIWIVDCMDRTNQTIGHCNWDADTGQLIEVVCIPQTKRPAQNAFNPRMAASVAKDWLRSLGLQNPDFWQFTASPTSSHQNWTSVFRCKSRSAVIRTDNEGKLISLSAY